MSLDRVQAKDGLTSLSPLPTSSGFPGGVDIGSGAGFAASAAADGGGALYFKVMPRDATAQTLTTGGTIVHNNAGCVMLTQAAAVNGMILQAGTKNGQHLWLVNTSAANSITFNGTASVSNVASGAEVIAVTRATLFVWNSNTSRWYRVA